MKYIPINLNDFQAIAEILEGDSVGCYCSPTCAATGVYKEMESRGIKLTGGSLGPITACAKCGAQIDMTEAFVSYESMEVMSHKSSVEVINAEGIADVCLKCDPEAFLYVAAMEVISARQDEKDRQL
jgi:hypothetical protein